SSSGGIFNSLLGLAGPISKLTGIGAIASDANAVGGAVKVISSLGNVIGFAEGGVVRETGLALVHRGEVIIPADEAARGSPLAGLGTPFHPIAQAIAGFFGEPVGDQYLGLTGAPDPTDPDDPRRTPTWSAPSEAEGDWSSADFTSDFASAD